MSRSTCFWYSVSKFYLQHDSVDLWAYLLLLVHIVDDLFLRVPHLRFDLVLQRNPLLLKRLLPHFERLDGFMHGMQFIQVLHSESVQSNVCFLLYQFPEVLFSVFPLLNLCLE